MRIRFANRNQRLILTKEHSIPVTVEISYWSPRNRMIRSWVRTLAFGAEAVCLEGFISVSFRLIFKFNKLQIRPYAVIFRYRYLRETLHSSLSLCKFLFHTSSNPIGFHRQPRACSSTIDRVWVCQSTAFLWNSEIHRVCFHSEYIPQFTVRNDKSQTTWRRLRKCLKITKSIMCKERCEKKKLPV